MKEEKQPKDEKNNPLSKYMALSGIGIQMGATIFLFSLGGRKLDAYYQTQKEWFTIAGVLIGVFVSIFVLLKQLKKINKSDN